MCRAGIETQTWRMDLWVRGKGRWARRESSTDVCTGPRVRQQLWEAAAQHREPSLLLCGDPEGWFGGGGREALEGGDIGLLYMRRIHVVIQLKLTQHREAIIL